MLEDLRRAPRDYQPTQYWRLYEEQFVPELKTRGLRDFRRRRGSTLHAFQAVDLVEPIAEVGARSLSRLLNNPLTRRIPGLLPLLRAAKSSLVSSTASVSYPDRVTPETLRRLYYGFAVAAGARSPNAKSLSSVEMSLAGNPEDVFEVDGRPYSLSFVQQYLRYAFASRFLDFDGVEVFVELGAGNGKQLELLRKLHPKACYLAFDIPPQLYVLHQYLSAVFPGDVVDYRRTRAMTRLEGLAPGKILVLGAQQFPLIRTLPRLDLFWNSASFQEMEPGVVANYLAPVEEKAAAVYLRQIMEGLHVAGNERDRGVQRPTTIEDYRRTLPSFELLELSPDVPFPNHSESVWKRRRAA